MARAAWVSPEINHATRVTRRADRRIMGKPGQRENLCGGSYTSYDVLLRDALKRPLEVRCEACRARLAAIAREIDKRLTGVHE